MNVVVVKGALSRAPEARELPSGSTVLTYEVSVRREGEATESVPVAWIDPPARAPAGEAGSEVVAVGRVRRRFFRSGGSTQSRTEVVAEVVVLASHHKRVQAAIAGAVERLEEAPLE